VTRFATCAPARLSWLRRGLARARAVCLRSWRMKRLWRNYNLSIVLAMLFLVSWILQGAFGRVHFVARDAGRPVR
jgi:hypothetical protein